MWVRSLLSLALLLAGCPHAGPAPSAATAGSATVSQAPPALPEGSPALPLGVRLLGPVLDLPMGGTVCGLTLPPGSRVYAADFSPCSRDRVAVLGQDWKVGELRWPAGSLVGYSACAPGEPTPAGTPVEGVLESWVRWVVPASAVQLPDRELPAGEPVHFGPPSSGGAYPHRVSPDDAWDRCDDADW